MSSGAVKIYIYVYVIMYAWTRAQSQTGKKEEIDKQPDRYPLNSRQSSLPPDSSQRPTSPQLLPSKKNPCSSYLVLLYKANCKLLLMHHPRAAT
jgi:hypothetical protein